MGILLNLVTRRNGKGVSLWTRISIGISEVSGGGVLGANEAQPHI